MAKLTLKSCVKSAKYGKKSVSDLVKISGEIFSMIKEGYEFDDDVLAEAHIKKVIRDVKCGTSVIDRSKVEKPILPTDRTSIKQILSELHTLDKVGKNEPNEDEWGETITTNNYNTNDVDEE